MKAWIVLAIRSSTERAISLISPPLLRLVTVFGVWSTVMFSAEEHQKRPIVSSICFSCWYDGRC